MEFAINGIGNNPTHKEKQMIEELIKNNKKLNDLFSISIYADTDYKEFLELVLENVDIKKLEKALYLKRAEIKSRGK